MSATIPAELVVWAPLPAFAADVEREHTPRPVSLIRPDTGELLDATDPAAVAAWSVAVREWREVVVDSALRLGAELLNHHLDAANAASFEVELDGARFEVKGESSAAFHGSEVIADPERLRDDLDVLVERRLLTPQAADAVCRAEVVTTWRTSVPKLRRLLGVRGEVSRLLAEHLIAATRSRKAPTVKRLS